MIGPGERGRSIREGERKREESRRCKPGTHGEKRERIDVERKMG